MKSAAKFGLVAVIALVLFLIPGGDAALDTALTLLTMALFIAVAWLGYVLFMRNRTEIESLADRQRLVLYGSIGLALLTVVATNRLFDEGGAGVLVWLALLGICSYGVFWVWTQYQSYG